MRTSVKAPLLALFLGLLALPAAARDEAESKAAIRALAKAERYLERGERGLLVAQRADDARERLRAIQRAKPSFKWARKNALAGLEKAGELTKDDLGAALEASTEALVAIATEEAEIYAVAGKLSLAHARLDEALELAPADGHALALRERIREGDLPEPEPEVRPEPAPRQRIEIVTYRYRHLPYRYYARRFHLFPPRRCLPPRHRAPHADRVPRFVPPRVHPAPHGHGTIPQVQAPPAR